MSELADLERRVEHLRSRASAEPLRPELATEIEDVLAEGYVVALRADAHSQRLRKRIDALMDDVDAPRMAEEVRRLGQERRSVELAASRLREGLATLRSLAARALGSNARSA